MVGIVVRSLGAVIEAALYLAVLFIAALIWMAEQAWEASVQGLGGTPWARRWCEGRPG